MILANDAITLNKHAHTCAPYIYLEGELSKSAGKERKIANAECHFSLVRGEHSCDITVLTAQRTKLDV